MMANASYLLTSALTLLVATVQGAVVTAYRTNPVLPAVRPFHGSSSGARDGVYISATASDNDESDSFESAAIAGTNTNTNEKGRRDFLNKAALGTTGAATAASFSACAGMFSSFGSVGLTGGPDPAFAAETPSIAGGRTSPKIALWGFGNQNKLMAKYLYERKIPVVAVISHHDIGEDYGSVSLDGWGDAIGVQTGVQIASEEDGPAVLAGTKPNVCIMCTRSTIADLRPALTVCAQAKVNVITIAEEVLDSWTSSPQITKQLDEVFRANGVSLAGSGFIDGACCEMALALSSMMHKIDALQGGLQYNVDDYGAVLAVAHGVGLTKSQFDAQIVKKPQAKSYVYNSNEWFARALGLTLISTQEKREPTFSSVPLQSKSIGGEIPAGDCTGMKVIATTTTKEGVTIVGEQIGKCYEPGVDEDSCQWKFLGNPSGVQFSMPSPPTPEMTNTAAISRVPQNINAEPGYITTDKLPIARYQHWA